MVVIVARGKPAHPLQAADPPSHGGDLPPHVLAEIQRIADAEARRLLAEQLNRNSVAAPTRSNGSPLNSGADQRPLGVEAEITPSLGNGQAERNLKAA